MDEDVEHQPDTVGRRISHAAKARGVKAKDLEAVSGLDRGSIAKLLRGDRESTSLESGLKIARFLGIDPYSLLPAHEGGKSASTAPIRAESLPPNVEELVAEAVAERLRPILARLRKIDQALSQPARPSALRQRK